MELSATTTRGLPLPSRIRAARDLRGWTQSKTASEMSRRITPAALSQIEAGKVRPTPETLSDLAQALRVPEQYFYALWSNPTATDEMPDIYFRDLRATPARERRRALALALLLNDLLAAIGHYVQLPLLKLPDLSVAPDASRSELEVTADALRAEWGLGLEPIDHMVRLIERKGVPVARLTMGHEKIDAFSVPFSRRPIILLTDDKAGNYVRSRSDAAHELGHLLMHRKRADRGRPVEQQAHAFAASFLLPKKAAETELPRRLDGQGWRKLAELKLRWGISMASLVRRMHDLHLLDSDGYRSAMTFMSVQGWRTQEPGDRELGPAESPLLLERALRTIEIEQNISRADLIQSAFLPLDDTLSLVTSSSDRRPVIEL